MEACSEALAVLSFDEAHDLFTKTFNPAFIQEEESNQRRNAAAKILKTAALKNKSPHLAAIAIQVQLDAFVRVKKAIDDMITQLLAEKKMRSSTRAAALRISTPTSSRPSDLFNPWPKALGLMPQPRRSLPCKLEAHKAGKG